MFDAKAFSTDVIEAVKGFVTRETAPLLARAEAAEKRAAELEQRLAAVEAREFPSIDGLIDRAAVDGALSPVIERLAELEQRATVPGPRGEPGEKGDRGERGDDGAGITDFNRGEGGHVIVTLSNGVTRDLGSFKGEKGDTGERGPAGPEGPAGIPGERGEMGEQGPAGPQGDKGDPGEKGERGEPGPTGPQGDAGPQGEKGIPGNSVEVEAAQDGRTVELAFKVGDEKTIFELELPEGPVGEKGETGAPGEQGPEGIPGAPGERGERGMDGLGFEDMDEYFDEDGRTLVHRYSRDDEVKEFRHKFGVPLDTGVYRDGMQCDRGDIKSCGGSLWIAQRDTADRPGTSDAWRMVIKRPRDGKPGKDPTDD